MTGITLSSEQIRSAPVEVRRWIEREVLASLGLQARGEPAEPVRHEHLVACGPEELAAVLSLIRGVLPAVNVFFELGREGAAFGQGKLEAFRVTDIAQRARLRDGGQVVACLDIINEAIRRARRDADATFYGLDAQGHCFIAAQTQQNILRLWQEVVAGQTGAVDGQAEGAPGIPPSVFRPDDGRGTASPPTGERAVQDALAAVEPSLPRMQVEPTRER